MSTINEIYHDTAENMRILSPLRVHCLEGENGYDVAVVYDFQYLSVMFIYFVYQYEKNCFLSPDFSINKINKRTWYYYGGVFCDVKGLTDLEVKIRSDLYLSLGESEVYEKYSKEVVDMISKIDFNSKFHYLISKYEPVSNELNFQKFLDNANICIR